MIRETSRMSSMSLACDTALRWMTSSALAVWSSGARSRNREAHPRMAFSGVRSSCDTVARNSSFVRLSASASVTRSCRAASLRRKRVLDLDTRRATSSCSSVTF
jgi:hypothetical protein